MYVLRRIRFPRRAWPQPKRIPTLPDQNLRLRHPDRAMSNALTQLQAGIPLNWSQVEDDPELETLAALQDMAQECRNAVYHLPQDLQSALINDLSSLLPQWKPEPVKAPPRSLAGFSESVQVLTQVEEDVPYLISRVPQWVAATLAASFVVMLALSVISNSFFAPSMPTYKWIQVLENGKPASCQQSSAGYTLPQCRGYSLSDPSAKRAFVEASADRRQLQSSLAFPIAFLPGRILGSTLTGTPTLTYTLHLDNAGIAPCTESSPSSSDPGAALKLIYTVRYGVGGASPGQATLKVFQANKQPAAINVTPGSWKQLRVADSSGVYWRGAPYRDIEGENWLGDVSVMIIERGDIITTFIGDARQGITEDMLTALLQEMGSMGMAQQTEVARTAPLFTWIEVRRGTQSLSAPQFPAGWKPSACDTPGPSSSSRSHSLVPFESLDKAQKAVGFPLLSFPEAITDTSPVSIPVFATSTSTASSRQGAIITGYITETAHITYTLALADTTVFPCAGGQVQPGDTGAKIKLRYNVRVQQKVPGRPRSQSGYSPDVKDGYSPDIVIFQTEQQPLTLDVSGGLWHEVQLGGAHGIYWSGASYEDPTGGVWPEGSSVMLLEKGQTVLTLLTRSPTADLLLRVSKNIDWGGSVLILPGGSTLIR